MSLKLHVDVKILALTVLVLPVLVSLGVWQLSRAEEKREIQTAFNKQRERMPVAWKDVYSLKGIEKDTEQSIKRDIKQDTKQKSLAFLPIVVAGEFDTEHTLLVDNKIYQGQVGYHVIQPLLVSKEISQGGKEEWLLVNRGWIAAPRTRDQLPSIPKASVGTIEINAEVYVPPGEAFKLDEQNYENISWPLVIQNVEIEKLEDLLDKDFFEYEIRLSESDPNLLQKNWQAISVQPEKHTAYAFQWFAMAVGLIFWCVFASTNLWQLMAGKNMDHKE